MFRSKTVFVLGAGASAEVGLPVGNQLLGQICKLIDIRYESINGLKSGDYLIAEALKLALDEGRSVARFNEHLHAAWQMIESASQAISIDNIVDGMEDDAVELIAKLGISKAIHDAEKKSEKFKKYENRRYGIDFRRFSETWYDYLTKIICESRR